MRTLSLAILHLPRRGGGAVEATRPRGTSVCPVPGWIVAAGKGEGELGGFLGRFEAAFTGFSAGTMDFLRRSRVLAERARESVSTVSEERTAGLLRGFAERLEDLEVQVGRDTDRLMRARAEMQDLAQHLREVVAARRRCGFTVRALQSLAVAIDIQNAQTARRGGEFAVLATDVRGLARQMEKGFERIVERAVLMERRLEATVASAAETELQQRRRLAEAAERLRDGMSELRRLRQTGATVSQGLHADAERLAQETGDLIRGLQFQDITRQRLEHVQASMGRLREVLQATPAAMDEEEAASTTAAVSALQISQLRDAIRLFRREMHGLAGAGDGLFGCLGRVRRGLGRRERAGEGRADRVLGEMRMAVSSALKGLEEVAEGRTRMGHEVQRLAAEAGEVGGLSVQIEALGEALELVAVNAIIRSCAAGEGSRSLEVIAQEIKRQSVWARELTATMAAGLRRVEEGGCALERRARDGGSAEAEGGEGLRALLGELEALEADQARAHDAVVAAGADVDRRGVDLDALRDLERELATVGERICSALGAVHREASSVAPPVPTPATRTLLDELATVYHMQSQRRIHEAGELVDAPAEADDLGDTVDFF